jgi:hypothetical protein
MFLHLIEKLGMLSCHAVFQKVCALSHDQQPGKGVQVPGGSEGIAEQQW